MLVDRQLLLGFLLNLKSFVECFVREYECELVVPRRIFDFALAFATTEGDRDAAHLDRLGRINASSRQRALDLFCLARLEELMVSLRRKLRRILFEFGFAVVAANVGYGFSVRDRNCLGDFNLFVGDSAFNLGDLLRFFFSLSICQSND